MSPIVGTITFPLCAHCHAIIDPDPQKRVWVIMQSPNALSSPLVLTSFMAADLVMGDTMRAFDSITCIKKFLLDWVDETAQRKAWA